MFQNDEHLEMLNELGLTFLQATTYLTLTKLGTSNAKTICDVSNIARSEVYRVISKLEEVGLVEKIIGNPTIYKAIPLKKGYKILLQNKTQKHNKLQKKTLELIKKTNESIAKTTLQKETNSLILISSKNLLERNFSTGDCTAQKSIDYCVTWSGLKKLFFLEKPKMKSAINRGVRIRIITEKKESDHSLDKTIQALKKAPLFEIRYVKDSLPMGTAIYDCQEVNFCLMTPKDGKLPSIWTKNFQVVRVISDYFDYVWNQKTLES
ncbi:MAG: hypothetical protein NWF06_09320 [Candidatus Bathyarchaeota archaeon]|nr:hypothetical protein [Candidatus Bathyarchaeum sp.]